MSKLFKYFLIVLGASNIIDFLILLFNYSNTKYYEIFGLEVSKMIMMCFHFTIAGVLLIPILKQYIIIKSNEK